MEEVVLHIDNLSKQYRLGLVGTGTISHDINRWWHKVRGKEDPYLLIGEENDREEEGGDYVWALRDINLKVKKGEVVGIIGKNGAGKSTLLKILSSITAPSSGVVKIKGRIASLLEVGTGFHAELTGRENIFLNGAILGMTKTEIQTKLDEIVSFSGIAKYIDTPVKRYSSGMKVRLGFAVAAHLEPDILIVDEVLAVGDVEFQRKCIGKMQDVANQGRTVLFVSHNMSAIQSLCPTSIILDKGKVVASGPSEAMVRRYITLNTEDYVKNPEEYFKNIAHRGSGHAYFKNIQIFNENGDNIGFTAVENSKVIFEITAGVKSSISDGLQFCLYFLSMTHKEVVTNTKIYQIDLEKVVDGEIVFKVVLDKVTMRPGEYLLNFWMGSGRSKGKYDVIDGDLPPFQVTIDSTSQQKDYNPINVQGYFNIPSDIVY